MTSTSPTTDPPSTELSKTVVLGMHRSGTSTVTGCLHALGLALPHADALFEAPGEPGRHEPLPVLLHSDIALRSSGATWHYPVDLTTPPTAWFEEASRVIDNVLPTEPWVLEEPRMCVLLDAWLLALPEDVAFVVVVRNPTEVVSSLSRRDGFTEDHGAALWELYNAELERSLQGRRVIVMTFDEIRAAPSVALRALGEFVGLRGDGLDAGVERAEATLDASLGGSSPGEIRPYVAARWRHLAALAGTHDRLVSDPVPCAPWAVAELRSAQQAEVAGRAAAQTRRKPMRIALARLPLARRLRDRRRAQRENTLTSWPSSVR